MKMTALRILAFLLWIAGAFAGSMGCLDLGGADHDKGCLDGTPCPEGMVCAESAECIPLPSKIPTLYFEIEPELANKQGDTAALPVELGSDQATLDGTMLRLVYPEPVLVQGEAILSLAGLALPDRSKLLVKVRVTAPSEIPGHARFGYVHDVEFDLSAADGEASVAKKFSFNLPPGKIYTLQVVPERADLFPPSLPVSLDLRDATQAGLEWAMGLESGRELNGRVVDALGTPLPGLEAWLTDATGIRVSTISAPTDEEGTFSLRTLAESGSFLLHIVPADDAIALPEVEASIELLPSDPLVLDLAAIVLPPFRSACEYLFQILGGSPSGADEPIAGATVLFEFQETVEDGLKVSYRAKAVSNPDGTVRLPLLPGSPSTPQTYNVTILPPVDSPYSALYVTREVSTCGESGPAFLLAPRSTVTGTVRGPDGSPIEEVTVIARPTSAPGELVNPLLQMVTDAGQSFSASTSADGRFLLRLDAGLYDLQFVPPASMLLPRWYVEAVAADGETPVQVDVRIPEPSILPGRLFDAHGRPLAGMHVKAYAIPEGCTETCATSAFLVAEASTSPDGTFFLLLPRID